VNERFLVRENMAEAAHRIAQMVLNRDSKQPDKARCPVKEASSV
jgi:hypothetical protein